MAKLYLKFRDSVLREHLLPQSATTIGRLPDNTLQIDNLAVSGHHARVFWNDGHYEIEDLGSLNGLYINDKRVGKATLIHGDVVKIGNHQIEFKNEGSMALGASVPKPGPAAPKLDATVVLDTRQARDMIVKEGASANGGRSVNGDPLPPRERIAVLQVVEGRTDQTKYVLTGKMTMIGKSSMATVKLKGFFVPASAVLISRRDSKYFIAPSERKIKLKINGEDAPNQRELNAGDVIELGKFKAVFGWQE